MNPSSLATNSFHKAHAAIIASVMQCIVEPLLHGYTLSIWKMEVKVSDVSMDRSAFHPALHDHFVLKVINIKMKFRIDLPKLRQHHFHLFIELCLYILVRSKDLIGYIIVISAQKIIMS